MTGDPSWTLERVVLPACARLDPLAAVRLSCVSGALRAALALSPEGLEAAMLGACVDRIRAALGPCPEMFPEMWTGRGADWEIADAHRRALSGWSGWCRVRVAVRGFEVPCDLVWHHDAIDSPPHAWFPRTRTAVHPGAPSEAFGRAGSVVDALRGFFVLHRLAPRKTAPSRDALAAPLAHLFPFFWELEDPGRRDRALEVACRALREVVFV